MNRVLAMMVLVLWLSVIGVVGTHAVAQTTTGEICVVTFADANGNGVREAAESPLAGVNVNLSTGGAIIATHILAEDEEQHCFQRLLPGIYTITFTDSPLYRATTASEGSVQLEAGQRLTIHEFGALPIGPSGLRAQVAADVAALRQDDDPLELSTRLLLATGGSMMVMLFMVGIGAVILGVISGGSRRGKAVTDTDTLPQPEQIAPPTQSTSLR